MRVRLTAGITGTRDGVPWPARGSEVTLPDEEGRQMVSAGLAVEVADAPEPEVAARKRGRRATAPRPESR